jgi:glycosyltransferase involved in cell wall biosynthesis
MSADGAGLDGEPAPTAPPAVSVARGVAHGFVGARFAAAKHGARGVDVLIVSLGSTAGLRAADAELADSLRRAGASVALVAATRPRSMRTLALTDLAWALAARRAAVAGLAAHRPRAVVYSSTTSALLWPRPGAIRFDAPSAGNRPGRHGLWQRPCERRRLARASLLLPWSDGALNEAPASTRTGDRALVLPVPVEPSGPPAPVRDIAAIAYAANPLKKGLDRVLLAWTRVRRPDEQLYVAGASPAELAHAGISLPSVGVTLTGPLPPEDYRALLRRARVFVCAPRREDYGLAQLEALADGCELVTTPAPGPYAALPIARSLDPRLVSDDLGAALRAALEDPAPDHCARAAIALAAFTRAAGDRIVSEELLPRLLSHFAR